MKTLHERFDKFFIEPKDDVSKKGVVARVDIDRLVEIVNEYIDEANKDRVKQLKRIITKKDITYLARIEELNYFRKMLKGEKDE